MNKNNDLPPGSANDIGAQVDGGSIYELIREDIVSGRLAANERLGVAELAERLSTSSNPVREALQQLRGEGFVVVTPNRGARVRPIDQDFVRDIYEIEMLLEPALTRWFVGMVTDADIAELERVQAEIAIADFAIRQRRKIQRVGAELHPAVAERRIENEGRRPIDREGADADERQRERRDREQRPA